MRSFRNRLLALIIGLAVLTQSVTLVAVLARVDNDVRARAVEQLRSGGSVAQQLIRFRANELSGAAAVLAADFGLHEAVASGDSETMRSAARNHAARIGADLVLLTDAQGRLLASWPQTLAEQDTQLLRRLTADETAAPSHAHFVLLGHKAYQLILAPMKAPVTIGWAAMGFALDEALASSISDLIGVEASFRTLGPQDTRSLAAEPPHIELVGGKRYLTLSEPLDVASGSFVLRLRKPMREVLAPYREVRDALLAIGGLALLLATFIALLLGRGATRPLRELVRAARRIQAGAYDTAVEAAGAEEFRSLAATFNAMQRDIAQREARITHDAYHDPLTGLANRSFAERSLDALLEEVPRVLCALIVIDIRNMREINASLGHHVGDDALREVARRLRQNVSPRDLVARLAANQFLVLARDCSPDRAVLLAEQLAGAVRSGFHLPAVSLELHVGAGACCSPLHGSASSELLRRVQIALEDAEESRTRVGMYREGRDGEHRRRLALAGDLRSAIERDELALVFQPKVSVATRTVSSFEALVRWTHPQLGAISPAEFVPIAERTGSSRRLTSWVLAAAIRQLAEWRRTGVAVEVAINLSAPDILDPLLGEEIRGTLRANGIEPSRLALEITESAVMRDAPLAARHMQLLRIEGVRFAIDDYGTGYSSLSQLSRLPVDELKIDRSFMLHAHERRDDETIVRSTIELAHSMGLKVVAEGVEDPKGWNLLRRLGCDFAQGYLISRPLPPAEVIPFTKRANDLLPASDSTVAQMRALTLLATERG